MVAGRVVQQHQPAAADLLTTDQDVSGDGGGERGDTLRRRDLFDRQLGAPTRRQQVPNGASESIRCRSWFGVRCHLMRLFAAS